jgi:hypothetical protein
MAACGAKIVRATQLAAVRAFLERIDRNRVMRAAHAAAGGGSLSLGDGHRGTLIKMFATKTISPTTIDAAQ